MSSSFSSDTASSHCACAHAALPGRAAGSPWPLPPPAGPFLGLSCSAHRTTAHHRRPYLGRPRTPPIALGHGHGHRRPARSPVPRPCRQTKLNFCSHRTHTRCSPRCPSPARPPARPPTLGTPQPLRILALSLPHLRTFVCSCSPLRDSTRPSPPISIQSPEPASDHSTTHHPSLPLRSPTETRPAPDKAQAPADVHPPTQVRCRLAPTVRHTTGSRPRPAITTTAPVA